MNPEEVVYLDNHATTRTDPRVVAAMARYWTDWYGNAGSLGHAHGWRAEEGLEEARGRVAVLLGCRSDEVVFTSGATEANNLAIKGAMWSARGRGRTHLVVSSAEHRAVLDVARRLSREGFSVSWVEPDGRGRIDPERVSSAIGDRTALVSAMWGNNEVGTLNPVAEIGALCRERGVLFHTDAAQAAGKARIDAEAARVDLLSVSGHKFHGPKGIGCLYARMGTRLTPLMDGGGQERGLRSGTVPVALAVGLGEAARICSEEGEGDVSRMARLRDRLREGLFRGIPDLIENGDPGNRLPNNLHVSVPGVEGEALLFRMRRVAVSSGAACSTGMSGPSHVLEAMGIGEELARASLRFGLGRFTTEAEVDFASEYVTEVVRELRGG